MRPITDLQRTVAPFKVESDFSPSGDQPTAIAELERRVNDGEQDMVLLGATGTGKTATIAWLAERLQRPLLVMQPNKTLAAQFANELRQFFPRNAVEYFVSYYDYYQPEAYVPSRDLYIEKDSSINEHIEQMRLSATKAILERPDCIIVATVSAIYGIGDPSEYHSMILHLKQGDTLSQRDAIKRLTEIQYQRNEMEFRRGTFRVRGDVLDIFPAESAENAIRVSLFEFHRPCEHGLPLGRRTLHDVQSAVASESLEREHVLAGVGMPAGAAFGHENPSGVRRDLQS